MTETTILYEQLMQNQLKPITPTRDTARHTRVIRFWTEGKMAESAFNRLTELRKDKREEEARVLLDEWIV